MANLLRGDPSHSAAPSTEASCKRLDEPDHSMSNWYFAREYIDKSSPSGIDGMDAKKEAYLRRSFCTYLQDLGMRLKMPQVTIATAIVFCHRFFIRQSHARNDRFTIATSCMFLAGKVEETPKQLKDVIFVSYEIRHKKDSDAVQRIKQKEVYEEQKERILMGERLVLATLGFDLNIQHPYKPLVAAIKKFKVSQSQLAQVAWNFVNDGLRTSLCLQFKPHHIAAGAIFLGAKFLKVKLPSEGGVAWWQEFDVTPRQLEEVSNQMLELYEHNKEGPSSRASGEPSPSPAGGCSNGKSSGSNGPSSTPATPVVVPATPALIVRNTFGGNTMKQPKTLEKRDDEQQITRESNASLNRARVDTHKPKLESISDNNNHDTALKDNIASNSLLPESPKKNGLVKEDEKVEKKGDASDGEFNKDKLRALLEKRRKQRAETGDTKAHSAAAGSVLTDEELLERDLENGVEVVAKGTSDDGILRKRKRGVDDDGRGGGVREMMEAADNCKDVGHATPLNSELAVTISNQPDTGGINQNGNNATNEKHWYPHGCDQSTDAALPKDRGDLQDKDCKKDRYVTEK